MPREIVDPASGPPPTLDYDATLPRLDPSWKGWSLWRGETWSDSDYQPMMFRWSLKGICLIFEGETFSEDDLILVPPGQLCPCWRQKSCKRHREPVAIEAKENPL